MGHHASQKTKQLISELADASGHSHKAVTEGDRAAWAASQSVFGSNPEAITAGLSGLRNLLQSKASELQFEEKEWNYMPAARNGLLVDAQTHNPARQIWPKIDDAHGTTKLGTIYFGSKRSDECVTKLVEKVKAVEDPLMGWALGSF